MQYGCFDWLWCWKWCRCSMVVLTDCDVESGVDAVSMVMLTDCDVESGVDAVWLCWLIVMLKVVSMQYGYVDWLWCWKWCRCSMVMFLLQTRSLAPSTPLTGRHYLKDREAPITPVSTATQSVSRLHSLLSGRKTCPSEILLEIFK